MRAIDDGRYLISEFRIFAPVLEGQCPGPWHLVSVDGDSRTFRLGEWPVECPALERVGDWATCRSCGFAYRATTEPDGPVVYRRQLKGR